MTVVPDILAARRQRLAEARFYAIFDLGYANSDEAEDICHAMLAGGVDIIQLRAKNAPREEIVAIGRRMAPVIEKYDALFIVNDDPGAAREAGAGGVHIGQDDMSVATARGLLASGQLVGKSTHSLAQAVATEAEMPDYLALGPLYATPTKPDYVPVGLPLVRQVKAVVGMNPFCIGGIHLETLPEVLAAGASRVVLVSGILKAPDITAYCQAVRKKLDAVSFGG